MKGRTELAKKKSPPDLAGRRCGFEHADGEGMIDFQVADCWLDHYHEQALTPRCSDQRQPQPASSEVRWENDSFKRVAP